MNADVSTAGVLVGDILSATGAPTEGVAQYWTGAKLTPPLPSKFIVIEPLYPLAFHNGSCYTVVKHVVQIRACATSIGASTALRDDVFNLLATRHFEGITFGPVLKDETHYDSILTVRTTVAPERI